MEFELAHATSTRPFDPPSSDRAGYTFSTAYPVVETTSYQEAPVVRSPDLGGIAATHASFGPNTTPNPHLTVSTSSHNGTSRTPNAHTSATTSGTPQYPHADRFSALEVDHNRPTSPAAMAERRGRDSLQPSTSTSNGNGGDPQDQTASGSSQTRNGGTSGISLVFKRPVASADVSVETPKGKEKARMDSPISVTSSSRGKKKRRVTDTAHNPRRSSRSRASSPLTVAPTETPPPSHLSRSTTAPRSSLPPSSAGATAAVSDGHSLPASLHIFAPPPDSALPQALQDVIDSSSSSRQPEAGPSTLKVDAEGDTLMREAGEGFEARRSGRARVPPGTTESVVRAGISARGTGVKVGNLPKDTERRVVKKKGKIDVPNQDFCSACRGVGKFLCCDGCPRSFHFMCLEPPLRVDELPEEETWYCKRCRAERNRGRSPSPKDKDPRPIPLMFKNLIKRVDEDNPSSFKLSTDLSQFFAGVSADSRGHYVDQDETRTKYDRKGFQEERDGTRLRDARSKPVCCYVCGGSSIPLRSHTTDPESTWRQIVSCDYCALHWHLDCLSPPLASMPNAGKKWMCPNHAEQVMARRRTVKNGLETVDVEARGIPNNGNIVVMPDEDTQPALEYEDLIINRKRYRVPEKIIRLDFWEKLGLNKSRKTAPAKGGDGVFKRRRSDSSSSSSLVSGEVDPNYEPTAEDLHAAHLVLGLTLPLKEEPITTTTTQAPSASRTASHEGSTDALTLEQASGKSHSGLSTPMNGTSDGQSHGTPVPESPASTKQNGTPRITLRLNRRVE